jgi:YggT family protein
MLHFIGGLIQLYILLLIARALLSWFVASPSSGLGKVDRVLAAITEPVLRPIRAVIRPIRVGGTYLDLSILVVVIVGQILVSPVFY